jgi:hypothetical protein
MLFDKRHQLQGLQNFLRRFFPLRADLRAGSQFVQQVLTEKLAV